MTLPSLFRNVAHPIATRSLLGEPEQGGFNLRSSDTESPMPVGLPLGSGRKGRDRNSLL